VGHRKRYVGVPLRLYIAKPDISVPNSMHAKVSADFRSEPWVTWLAYAVVAAVFLPWDGHDRRAGLFPNPGRRGVFDSCVRTGFLGEANALVAGQLHVEETKVMDVLCVPSSQQILRQPRALGLN